MEQVDLICPETERLLLGEYNHGLFVMDAHIAQSQ